MPPSDSVTTSAAELIRRFGYYSELSLSRPVVVTRNGRPRNVLISVDEYERLNGRQQAFLAADTPDEFIAEITKLAET